MKFNYAILKSPSREYENLGANYVNILKQHDTLIHFLKNIGIKVHIIMPNLSEFGINVGQSCLTTRKCVIFSNSNSTETINQKSEVALHLSRFYPLDSFHFISYPSLFSSEDVIVVNDTFYISISDKTNLEGASQAENILLKYGFRVKIVNDSSLPLRQYLNYLEFNNLMIKKDYTLPSAFQDFNLIEINNEEEDAIGSIYLNETIIFSNNNEISKQKVNSLGKYVIVSMNDSEFKNLRILLKNLVILF